MKKLFLTLLISFVFISCGSTKATAQEEYMPMQEDSSGINLQIVEQRWSAWKRVPPEPETKQPEPKTEIKRVKKGDIINLNYYDKILTITIEDINNSGVIVRFDTPGIVKYNPDGKSINLRSENHNWTDIINYNEEYKIGTQTMDAGRTWKFTFME